MSEEKINKHPAYGMIGIAQVDGDAVLVGSAVKHQHYIALEIREAERHYDLNHEWWFARKLLVKINISHAQLAEMLFSINHGNGVPCTLRYVDGDGEKGYRELPPYESPFKEATDDLVGAVNRMMETAQEFAKEAQDLIAKGLSTKKDRERLKFLAECIVGHVKNNIGFASRSVDEKMEKVVAHAKSEIETFVDLKLKSAGVQAFKEKMDYLPTDNEQNHSELLPKG